MKGIALDAGCFVKILLLIFKGSYGRKDLSGRYVHNPKGPYVKKELGGKKLQIYIHEAKICKGIFYSFTDLRSQEVQERRIQLFWTKRFNKISQPPARIGNDQVHESDLHPQTHHMKLNSGNARNRAVRGVVINIDQR